LIYYYLPIVFNKINVQGGQQLVANPIYSDALYRLGTYEQLNGTTTPDYAYAISFWVFIDAAYPTTNAQYQHYTSLLNYGNKPNVMYNGRTNTLRVTMLQKDLDKNNTSNKLTDFDEEGHRILYVKKDFLLQKWNNIIINYSNGVLDIFLNGELVKSNPGVVPYYTLDSLTVGELDGIKGGICNVVYFKQPLTTANISYLYNMVKHKPTPIMINSDVTIVPQIWNQNSAN
jgi:hypothetical protein